MLLSSCGILGLLDGGAAAKYAAAMGNVKEGMPQKDINQLLGPPDYRRFDAGLEEWEYVTAYSQVINRVIIIRFIDGEVTGMDTFTRPVPHNPHHHNTGTGGGK